MSKITHIVPTTFKTKKSFKEAIKNGENVYLYDPAIINPCSGSIDKILESTEAIYATNHPKRSWFAQITRNKKTGKIVVK